MWRKRSFQRLLSLFHDAPSHFHPAHSPSEPPGTPWTWNDDCFVSQAQRWGRILGWNFPQQIWESRKENMFNPIHQPALLSHQWPSAPRRVVRIFMVTALRPSSSSAAPLCTTDSKFCVLLLKSLWTLGFHPFLLEPNLSGAAESEDILKERLWEILLWKPGLIEVFFSLRHAEQIWAFCSLKTDEFFQNMPKWSTIFFLLYLIKVAHQSLWRRGIHKEGKEGFLFNRV